MTKILLSNVSKEVLLKLWLLKIEDDFELSACDLLFEHFWLWALETADLWTAIHW